MSTLRISNIEAKSVPASATIDEKVKITNSSGDVLVFLDGKTSGITTVGINTTDGNITFDANSNVVVTGIITATKFVGTIEPTNLTVGGDLTIPDKIIHSGDTNTAIRFPSADTISAETGGTERLRISSNGLVNIGAGSSVSGLSPLLHLHKNASSSTAYLHITNNTTGITNNDGFLLGINGVGDCLVFNKDSTPIRFATAGLERLRISSAGRVLIGTTTEGHGNADDLTIATAGGSLGHTGITIRSGTSSDGNIFFSDATSGDGETKGVIKYAHSDDSFRFNTAGSERLRIDSSGRTFLGVAPQGRLCRMHISGDNFPNAAAGGSQVPLIVSNQDADYGLQIGAFSSGKGFLQATRNDSTATVYNIQLNPSGGNVEIPDGDLVVANGHGIDFSNTVNGSGFSQELLDDYEEGNFNGADVSGGGLTLSYSNTGRYVKVGRQVYVIFDITYPSNSDSANISRVSTPYQAHLPYGGGWIGWTDLGRPCQVHVSGANVYFMDCNSSGTAKHLYNSELSGKRIIGGYMLMTNS